MDDSNKKNDHLEKCPGCGKILPVSNGGDPIHRYVDVSKGCWEIFSNLTGSGIPIISNRKSNSVIVDAYLTQHHINPSPQAIQSVAVHLLVLYSFFDLKTKIEDLLWVRQRVTRQERKKFSDRFFQLNIPDWKNIISLSDAVLENTPDKRAEKIGQYVESIWIKWSEIHLDTIKKWYKENVI